MPVSLSMNRVRGVLVQNGYSVEQSSFYDFDFSRDYKDYFIIYTSAEDYCGGSKSYIEDVLLFLLLQGAKLIPNFFYFRAHDNKVMMELLKKRFKNEKLKTISTDVWPNWEKFKENGPLHCPLIIKESTGAGGGGVYLARDWKNAIRYGERASRMLDKLLFWYLSIVNIKQRVLRKAAVPIHNQKFISQNMIEGLLGDYKVLVFSDHYFILHRLNRKNDFRASGSGCFADPDSAELLHVLNFAKECKGEIDSPCLSLDICFDGETCHLIEFQCVSFGFKAMSLSRYHFKPIENGWLRIEGEVDADIEFALAVLDYLQRYE